MVRHYDGMKMGDMVMCGCGHTHSERRFEEGNTSLSKATGGVSYGYILWELGHGRTWVEKHTMEHFLRGRTFSEARANLAHYAAYNGWLSFD